MLQRIVGTLLLLKIKETCGAIHTNCWKNEKENKIQ